MKKMGKAGLFAGASLALAGCGTVTSHYAGEGVAFSTASVSDQAEDGDGDRVAPIEAVPVLQPEPQGGGNLGSTASSQNGILYFLPRQLAKVTAKRTERKLDGGIKTVEQKLGDVHDAEAEIARISATIEKTENDIIAGSGGDAAKKILADRLAAQKTELAEAKKGKTDKVAALAEAKANLKELIAVARSERRWAEANAAVKAARKGEEDATKAKVAVEADIAKIKKDIADLAASDPNSTSLLDLRAKLKDRQDVDLKQAVSTLATKTKAHTDAKATLAAIAAGTPDPVTSSYAVALKIELQAPSADPAQAFRLDPNHSWLRDDQHKLKVGKNGLLSSANITAEDRTADILVEIGTFAGAIVGRGMGGPGFLKGGERDISKPRSCAGVPDDYTTVVDFADPASIARMNYDLQCLGVRTLVEGSVWRADIRPAGKGERGGIDGIVYRTPVEVQVRIERCSDKSGICSGEGDWVPTETLALALPQAGPISYVRQRAGMATKTTYGTTFSDGILTDYDDNRPSEALHLAAAPMRVLNGVFDGISKVISLRTGRNNALAGLSASQLALLNAQANYETAGLDNQRKLTDAERTLYEARIALQAAATNGERTLTEAQIALIEKQVALQVGQINGATSLANAQLGLIQAQTGLVTGTNTAQVQLSASELALAIALLRDRARTQSIGDCLASNGPTAVDICIP